jgi:integrase
MGRPRSLEAQITYEVTRSNKGSYTTQADRIIMLKAIGTELRKEFRLQQITNLKPKHIIRLVEIWKSKGISNATIGNRMAGLRYLACDLLKKHDIIPAKNSDLGIERRTNDFNTDKGWTPTEEFKQNLPETQQIHVDLMRNLGLRYEEAAKFRPNEADRGTKIAVIWGTKGGRPRELEITNEKQRETLDRAKEFVDKNYRENIIPREMTYKKFEDHTRNIYTNVGITKEGVGTPHGLRHQYAQDRYEAITGWKPPAQRTEEDRRDFKLNMTQEEKDIDTRARLQITSELGHGRIDVVSNYIGSWHS